MATARITDNDRNQIASRFHAVARQSLNNQVFPVAKDDFKEWTYSLLPEDIRDRWLYLKEKQKNLIRMTGGYNSHFKIRGDLYEYRLSIDEKIPYEDMPVPLEHPTHEAILKYCDDQYEAMQNLRDAMSWLEYCVNQCHSVGQIKRVLTDDIIRFVPNYFTSTLADAERASRIPRDFTPNDERMEQLANVLALGTLSPERRKGLDVSLVLRQKI